MALTRQEKLTKLEVLHGQIAKAIILARDAVANETRLTADALAETDVRLDEALGNGQKAMDELPDVRAKATPGPASL